MFGVRLPLPQRVVSRSALNRKKRGQMRLLQDVRTIRIGFFLFKLIELSESEHSRDLSEDCSASARVGAPGS